MFYTFDLYMLAESGYIILEKGRLHYRKTGAGQRLLVCFHGYANNAAMFQALSVHLETEFTVISVDLPHHGRSEWERGVLLQQKDLVEIVKGLLNEYGLQQLSLAGYSLGGRVCLKIMELLPECIQTVLLIASDGLVFNPLYFFVTRTLPGRNIFRNFLSQPSRYLKMIDWMKRRMWIDASRHKFAMAYLGSEADRRFLLKVWQDMSLIVPDRKKLRMQIRAYRIPVFVFMGRFDKVIPMRHARKFSDGLDSVQIITLEKGHGMMDRETVILMARSLI